MTHIIWNSSFESHWKGDYILTYSERVHAAKKIETTRPMLTETSLFYDNIQQ